MIFLPFLFSQLSNLGFSKAVIVISILSMPIIDLSVIRRFQTIDASNQSTCHKKQSPTVQINHLNKTVIQKARGIQKDRETDIQIQRQTYIGLEINPSIVKSEIQETNAITNSPLKGSVHFSIQHFCTTILKAIYSKILKLCSITTSVPSALFEMLIILFLNNFISSKLSCFKGIKEFGENLSLQTNAYEETRKVFTNYEDGNETDSDSEWETISDSENTDILEEEHSKNELDLDSIENSMQLCEIQTEILKKSKNQKPEILFAKIDTTVSTKMK